MPNTKVVGIIFPYILTPIPNRYPAGAVTVCVASLADAELVTTGVTNGVDATPMIDRDSYDSHDDPVLPDMWCTV